jgi:hypothetical protein
MRRRDFLRTAAAATAGLALGGRHVALAASDTYAFFALNVQDFTYPGHTAALLTRALDLHESLAMPVDVSLTTWMVDLLQGAPDIARRLVTSPVVSLSYHTRPPAPHHVNYDWYGLAGLSPAQQYAVVLAYETRGLDMVNGVPLDRPGGYQYYASLIGRPPISVGDLADNTLQTTADTVLRDLGAQMCVVHGRTSNLGEQRNGLYTRPEHYDLRLFEYVGQDPRPVIDAAFVAARSASEARPPYFVGIKMHDNDFIAEDSAWITVYQRGRRTPPWDITRMSPLLSAEQATAMWTLYETAVRHVAASGIPVFNTTTMLQMARDARGIRL